MSDYKITFSPELNINATDFVDGWNNLEQCQKVAEAKAEPKTQGDYNLGELAMMAVLTGISTSASIVLSELIKHTVAEYFKKRQQANNPPLPEPESIEVREIEQPNGSKLVVVVLKQ